MHLSSIVHINGDGVNEIIKEIRNPNGQLQHWVSLSFFYVFISYSSAFLIFLVMYFIRPMSKPKVCLCEHFLILNHYRDVVSWNDIVDVRLEGDALVFNVRKIRFKRNTYSLSLSYISKKEELLDDIESICKAKGIPTDRTHPDI